MYVNDEAHPIGLGMQVDWPVFVKVPFSGHGKAWRKSEPFPWLEMGVDHRTVLSLYNQGFIYHNRFLQDEKKVGDRLSELTITQLDTVQRLLNVKLKENTQSKQEFTKRRCRVSKIKEKQAALIRRFLYNEPWISDYFYELRDNILKG